MIRALFFCRKKAENAAKMHSTMRSRNRFMHAFKRASELTQENPSLAALECEKLLKGDG